MREALQAEGWMGRWRQRPERGLLAFTGALTLLLLGSVLVGSLGAHPSTQGAYAGGWSLQDETRTVLSQPFLVPPGQVVEVDLTTQGPFCMQEGITNARVGCLYWKAAEGALQAVRLYVVESGEAQSFVRGDRPPHVYLEVDGTRAWRETFTFVRPVPPATKAGLSTSWSAAGSTVTVPGINAPNGLEFVFVVPTRAVGGVVLWADFDNPGLDLRHGGVQWFDPWLPAAQGLLGVLAFAAVVGIVASAAAMRWRRVPAVPPEARDTEALLHLVARAQGYLQGLRNALAATGVLLALLGAVLLAVLASQAGTLGRLSPLGAWPMLTGGGFILAFGALFLAWFLHYRAVSAELRRFREQTAGPPPRLGGG